MPQYQIVGSDLQAIVCNLSAGEKVIAETGHLLSLTDGIELNTGTGGGFMAGLKRALGGSSFFVNELQTQQGGQAVFASPSPGHIQEIDVTPSKGWLCQPNVFLCADSQIQISAALTQRFGAGLFGGTGFILQSLAGQGKAFIHVGGASLKYDLKPGESLRIETGSLAAFESTVTYDIQMVRGWKSILFSGEGLWFAHLTGPGTVYVQSLALPRLAHALIPYMPVRERDSVGGAVATGAIGGLLGAVLGSGGNDDVT
jgi:uncharacterized protein (TIGR00266 family)